MNYVLKQILSKNKITDYLQNKGINHLFFDGEKYRYRCPLPGHKTDKTPSFFVYDKPGRQDYFCFGCKSSGNFINFISAFECIPIKEAILQASKGIEVDINSVITSIIYEINNPSQESIDEQKKDEIISLNLFISSYLNNFIKKSNFEAKEVELVDKIYSLLDDLILKEDLNGIKELSKKVCQRIEKRIYNKHPP